MFGSHRGRLRISTRRPALAPQAHGIPHRRLDNNILLVVDRETIKVTGQSRPDVRLIPGSITSVTSTQDQGAERRTAADQERVETVMFPDDPNLLLGKGLPGLGPSPSLRQKTRSEALLRRYSIETI